MLMVLIVGHGRGPLLTALRVFAPAFHMATRGRAFHLYHPLYHLPCGMALFRYIAYDFRRGSGCFSLVGEQRR